MMRRNSKTPTGDVDSPGLASRTAPPGTNGRDRQSSSSNYKFTLNLTREITCTPISEKSYETLKKLGRGAFGSVYLVKCDKESSRGGALLHAMKTVKFESDLDIEAANKEIKLLVTLQHPYVTQLHDLFTGSEGKTINMLLTYCDGGDLSKMIKGVRNAESDSNSVHKAFNSTNFLRW